MKSTINKLGTKKNCRSDLFRCKQNFFIKLIYFVTLFLVFASPAFTTTIYINYSSGNDATGNGSLGNPYKTFTKGYTIAASGDTLNLTGTFTWTNADETGDNTSGFTINKNLTIRGQGAALTIVQAHSSENSADRRVFNIGAGYTVTIRDLTIRHGRYFLEPGSRNLDRRHFKSIFTKLYCRKKLS